MVIFVDMERNGNKRGVARQLFFSGYAPREIASRVGVSERTVTEWAKNEDWRKQKIANNISRAEIVNKNLNVIGGLLVFLDKTDICNENIKTYSQIVDQITKLTAVIEKLDSGASAVSAMEVFDDFGIWLDEYATATGELKNSEIDKIEYLFRSYVSDKFNSDKK